MAEEDDKELLQIRIETLKTMIGKLKKDKPNEKKSVGTSIAYNKRETLLKTTTSIPSSSSTSLSWTKLQAFRKQNNRFTFKKTEEKSHSDTEIITNKCSRYKLTQAADDNIKNINYQSANRYKWDKNSPMKCSKPNSILPSTTANNKYAYVSSTSNDKNHTILPNKISNSSELNLPNTNVSTNHTVISKFKLVKKGLPNKFEIDHRKVPKRTNLLDESQRIKFNNLKKHQTNTATLYNANGFPKQSAADILSKYKVVRKTNPTTLVRTRKQPSSFVWKKGDNTQIYNSSSSFTMNKMKYAEERFGWYPTKDSFIRRRFNVTRRSSPAQSKANIIALNQAHRIMKKRKQSFALRRLNYVKTRSPATVSVKNSNLNSPNKHLILSRHGTHFKVAGNFRSLRRLSANNENKSKQRPTSVKRKQSKYKFQRSNSFKQSCVKRKVASQVLKRSLTQAQRKKVNRTKFCLFYNRFGKCKRGKDCKYIHDPDKIAVCTRFLRGTCKDEKCLFSHKIDPMKMPVCSYFLQGECSKDNCPYRHVNVGESAMVCDDFLKGYCPRQEKCTKKHVLQCIEFSKTGKCKLGKKCTMLHRVVGKRRRSSSMSGARRPRAFRLKRRKLDDSSVLSESEKAEQKTSNAESPLRNIAKLHLLPRFISEKVNATSDNKGLNKPNSFSAMRNLFNFENQEVKQFNSLCPIKEKTPDARSTSSTTLTHQKESIPLRVDDSSDSETERVHLSRTFSFKEQDFIAL